MRCLLSARQYGRAAGAERAAGDGINEEIAYTLTGTDVHGVAKAFSMQRSDEYRENELASTQAARQYKSPTDLVCSAVDCRNYKEVGNLSGTLQAKDKPGYSLNYQNPVRTGYIVRRLTPTECERLMATLTAGRRLTSMGNPSATPNATRCWATPSPFPAWRISCRGSCGILTERRLDAASLIYEQKPARRW